MEEESSLAAKAGYALLLATIGIVTFVVYLYWSNSKRYPALAKLAEAPRKFLVGHTYIMAGDRRETVAKFLQHRDDMVPHKVTAFYVGPYGAATVWHPDVIQSLLHSSKHAVKNPFIYSHLVAWLGDGLLLSYGAKWKSRRHLITPSFHSDILKSFVDVMQEQTDVFVDVLRQKSREGKPFDIFEPITLCALDIINETAMGAKIDAQRDGKEHPYVRAVYDLSKIVFDRSQSPLLMNDFIFYLSPQGRLFRKSSKISKDFSQHVIEKRRAWHSQVGDAAATATGTDGRPRRQAFLDVLLNSVDDNGVGLDNDAIQEEVDTFMFEGHDTTSASIAWTCHLLAKYPDVQRRAQEEVDDMYASLQPGEHPTPDDLAKLKYLDRVLKESLRVYPSVPFIGRELTEDLDVDGVTLPKGLPVVIPILALHSHPEFWPDAEKFDPDRWEGDIRRHPYSYIPFSAGPRNCIGQKFAQIEEKILVASVLRYFDVTTKQMNPPSIPEAILRPADGIIVSLTERKHI